MTAALIIATGTRSGRDAFDPGLKVGTISAIERIILLFQLSGIKDIVVCGEDDEVKKLVPAWNLVFLPPASDGEMLHNIQNGIQYLQKKADQILVCHVDIPLFSVQTVKALMAAEGPICIPAYQGVQGHPALLRQAVFENILSYHGPNGLKGAMNASGFPYSIVEVEDAGILADAPAMEDYTQLLPNHDVGKLRLSYQFKIGREAVFYGPGVHQLLLLTDDLHSLSEACKYMGISYSKGRKIIQTMEEQMKYPVLESQQGGRGGGYSRLTDRAKDMTRRYDAFLEEAEGNLQALFAKHFGMDGP